MFNRNLIYFIFISILFTFTYGLTIKEITKTKLQNTELQNTELPKTKFQKNELSKSQQINIKMSNYTYESGNCSYCKDDICVPCSNQNELGTIIIPNKEGINKEYIIEACSSKDIDLNLCFSKNCTVDSDCVSNKCTKGHCCYNDDDNSVHQCQHVRTIHSGPIFGDGKGYKTHCGLPYGYQCKNNKECSSFNCERYHSNNDDYGKCGEPDDSGCHSTCGLGGAIVLSIAIPLYVIFLSISCCYCCCYCKYPEYRKNMKHKAIIVVILSALPWIVIICFDIYKVSSEGANILNYIWNLLIIIAITSVVIGLICKIKVTDEEEESTREKIRKEIKKWNLMN